MVKSKLKLSKNSIKLDQLVKNMAYPPYGLNSRNLCSVMTFLRNKLSVLQFIC